MRCRCTRREVLVGAALAGAGSIAGCLGDEDVPEEAPEPVALDGGKLCDVCGMVIEDHFGPNGQVFYADEYPPGREGPAWYDSVRELFVDRFAQEERGHEPVATYVVDYARVDYEVREQGGTGYLSTHVEADSFVDAEDVVFVVESAVEGAMGPDLVPFTDEGVAESFVDAEGGRIAEYDDVTLDLLNEL